MRRLTTAFVVLLIAAALATGAAADGHYADSTFDASLTGGAEVPAVDTSGSGYAVVEVAADGSSIDYRLYAEGLDDATMAHVHVGGADENGPVVVFLFGPEEPGVTVDGLIAEGTITQEDLIEAEGFDGTMDELIGLMEAGETYVNLHTEANPAGEIRGQLSLASFNFHAPLSGDAEVPPVETQASGVASLALSDSQTELDFTLVTHGLDDTTMAHIHIGASGENGPPVVFLFGPEEGGVSRDGVLAEGTITEDDLIMVADVFDGSMQSLVDNLRSGDAYVNVHTVENPPGEVRGQVDGLERIEAGSRFTDDDDSVHESDIEVIAAAGITRGCNPPDNDEFCPTDVFTRGQGAAFFNRALNLTASEDDAFTDDDDSIFEGDINAIAARGITVGCNPPENTQFCPDDTVTRAQWASLMVRALGLTEGGDDDRFTDDDGSVHEQDINRIAAAGITLGCNPPDNDRFCPDDDVTREQAASFFLRVLGWRSIDP